MPCSQMTSTNCRPPYASRAVNPVRLPAVNALIRSRRSWNSGSATLRSITANTASRAAPPAKPAITAGLVQPIVWPSCDWIP